MECSCISFYCISIFRCNRLAIQGVKLSPNCSPIMADHKPTPFLLPTNGSHAIFNSNNPLVALSPSTINGTSNLNSWVKSQHRPDLDLDLSPLEVLSDRSPPKITVGRRSGGSTSGSSVGNSSGSSAANMGEEIADKKLEQMQKMILDLTQLVHSQQSTKVQLSNGIPLAIPQ